MSLRLLRRRTSLYAFASLLVVACGGPPEAVDSAPIADLAGHTISMAEFRPVLERHVAGGGASDAVKSRLLDQFLDDRVLAEEARRRGIQVADHEIDRALSDLEEEDTPAHREEIRANLLVQRLLRVILGEASDITPEEEEAYYRDHSSEFRESARIEVRQILMDDAAEAVEVHAEVSRDAGSFADIAAERSSSPDRGRPLTYGVDALPSEVAAVLEELSPGSISPVIEAAGHHWIFLVEAVHEKRSLALDEARPEIRARLQEERGNGAMAVLLEDLKGQLGLRLHTENLPFRYVEEEPA